MAYACAMTTANRSDSIQTASIRPDSTNTIWPCAVDASKAATFTADSDSVERVDEMCGGVSPRLQLDNSVTPLLGQADIDKQAG